MARYWLVVGSVQNWQIAFEHGNIWGLKNTQRYLWDSLSEDDLVLFYATQPVGGVIGYGTVRTRFRQDQPLWPQEIRENQVIWPLRFEIDVLKCLPPDEWKTARITSEALKPLVRSGFQLLNEHIAHRLIADLEAPKARKVAEAPTICEKTEEEFAGAEPAHDELKQWLVEIGKLQKFIAEKEYPFDVGRLDVVWRRVEKSVPTYVFEVQIGGNLYQALTKLKHAFDLWNSHIFLVATKEDHDKVRQLTSGTFHEIHGQMKFLDANKVKELHALKTRYRDLERTLGIL